MDEDKGFLKNALDDYDSRHKAGDDVESIITTDRTAKQNQIDHIKMKADELTQDDFSDEKEEGLVNINLFDENVMKKIEEDVKTAVEEIKKTGDKETPLLDDQYDNRKFKELSDHLNDELKKTNNDLARYSVLKTNISIIINHKKECGMNQLLALSDSEIEKDVLNFKKYNKNDTTRKSFINEKYPEIRENEINKKFLNVGIDNCNRKISFIRSRINDVCFIIENLDNLSKIKD